MSRIIILPDGFELTSDAGERIAAVDWTLLDRIEAYHVEIICLDFFSEDQLVSVNEEDWGFEDLVPQLIANLDLENPDWFGEILRPALESNRILVFDREAGY